MLYRHPSPAAGTALGVPKQVPTSSRFAMIPPTNCLARQESDKNAPPRVRRYRSLNAVLEAGFFRSEAKILCPYRLIATMDALAPLPSLVDQAVSLGLNIEPCVHLGVESVGGTFGGEGIAFFDQRLEASSPSLERANLDSP
jgi:hypothetical protein